MVPATCDILAVFLAGTAKMPRNGEARQADSEDFFWDFKGCWLSLDVWIIFGILKNVFGEQLEKR